MSVKRYTVELPWNTEQAHVDMLRGLGDVKMVLVIEGENRNQVARELEDEMTGWHHEMGDRDWWLEHMSRGKSVK